MSYGPVERNAQRNNTSPRHALRYRSEHDERDMDCYTHAGLSEHNVAELGGCTRSQTRSVAYVQMLPTPWGVPWPPILAN